MVAFRGLLSVAMILCGIVIVARMAQSIGAGFAVLPGIVLGGAMIALGAHRLALILRLRGTL